MKVVLSGLCILILLIFIGLLTRNSRSLLGKFVETSKSATKNYQTLHESLKELRKVNAATEVGINMIEYGKLVVNAKAAVNDAILYISDT